MIEVDELLVAISQEARVSEDEATEGFSRYARLRSITTLSQMAHTYTAP